MASPFIRSSSTAVTVVFFLVSLLPASQAWPARFNRGDIGGFIQCISSSSSPAIDSASAAMLSWIYSPANASFSDVLESSIFNLRYLSPETPKPSLIMTPSRDSEVRSVVVCAKKTGALLKIRSGGHDMEGISYVSRERPFVLLDLRYFRSISVDYESETAWVGVGATLGEVYYGIASKSSTLGFPGGLCPTVGAGGHISGGGYGMMIRMHGLAADQVVDARMILADGRIVDRRGMGEDVFWAIRGAGSSGFGVIIAWKVKLVRVPRVVTVFTVNRNSSQNMTGLIHKWQYVSSRFPKELTADVNIQRPAAGTSTTTLQASFFALYLGRAHDLLNLTGRSFPELGLTSRDCQEMRWIESVLYFRGLQLSPLEQLLVRTPPSDQSYYKMKIDYFTKPVPLDALQALFAKVYDIEEGIGQVNLVPYGGRMAEIPSSEIPYPHRSGNLFHMFYFVTWTEEEGMETTARRIDWVRDMYAYMTPYVSSATRRASYVNYRDLDIGTNTPGLRTTYSRASVWGEKYFQHNFNRLVTIKSKVDPHNFFRSEQSIPPLS